MRDRRASRPLVVLRVETDELFHFGRCAERVQMLDERRRGCAIATVGWEEIEYALKSPELVLRSNLVVPQEPRGTSSMQ